MDSGQGRTGRDRPLTRTVVAEPAASERTLVSPNWPEAPDEQIGGRVGRYWLKRELGAGGMGVVYEGYDPELERPVAVKLLRSAFDRERLSREARALARLSHPNVVAVYDVGTFDDRAFIAMELVEGTTLRSWVAERPRSLDEVLRVALQAGRGLAAAHAAGLLHRDFKPDNVMVGRDSRVRVLDFGIVRAFEQNATAAALLEGKDEPKSSRALVVMDANRVTSSAGALVGTPAYMAPEQLRGRPIAPTADQFSFCVVLWELVYRARPFPPDSLLELMRGSFAVAPTAPPGAPPAPSWLRRVLERGLALDSAARYPSMAALLGALDAGLTREATERRLLGRRYEILAAPLGTPLPGAQQALDRFTGRVVTIQRLGSPGPFSGEPLMVRYELARAFKERASLHHPNLIGVLDFGCDQAGAPYWVLDLKDAGVDLLTATQKRGARPRLDHFVQLLHALGYLHKHRVLLGALDPAMILVVDDQVRLAPLPLSPGAARYVAPEVAAGAPPNAVSDLYALGALALAHLWREQGGSADVHAEPESVRSLGVDGRAVPVLERLLLPDPAARYQTAEDVARALEAATGHGSLTKTLEMRESQLRAAPFLGHDEELFALEGSVRAACAGGGAAWLVIGESGVGKSRILEEVGSLSIAHGAFVLRGHEEREGGSPYRLFRDVLLGLALVSDLDELEASVLLPAVPNLGEALGRSIPPAPELDALSTHGRLVDVVRNILLRQEQPIVLLLDDVQWARSDSLDLLQRLATDAVSSAVLIVATARDDVAPGWNDALGGLCRMHLGRLPRSAIAQLAEAMIGENGRHPALLELLQRETEGNAFFLVEVVRALAEEVGGLERISPASLPEKVFAEGVHSLVQQRLRAVSRDARALLRVAAVSGKRLEPRLLARLMPETALDDCIARCIEAAILERSGEVLRFRHDKLREGVLATLTDQERALWHGRVAGAMESEHAGDPQIYAALAHHFGCAGNRTKEAHYAALAGDYALLHGAIREAIELLERSRSGLLECADLVALGRVCVTLSDAYYLTTDIPRAMTCAEDGSSAVGFRFPSGKFQRAVALVWQLLLHVAYRLWPGLAARGNASTRPASHVASLAAASAATVQISQSNAAGVLFFSLMAWNLAERARCPNLWASGILGYGLATVGLTRLARGYFASSERASPQLEQTYVLLKIAFLLGVGELEAAEALVREELELVRRTGFYRGEAFRWFILGYCAYYRGDLEEAAECFGRAIANEGARANFTPGLALVLCLSGRASEAESLLGEALHEANPASPRSTALGALALIQTRRDDVSAALLSADSALALANGEKTFGYAGAPYFTGIFEAYLAELERAKRDGRPAAPSIRRLRRATRHCRSWARAFRIGRPLLLLYEGKRAKLLDRPERARRLWLQSYELAQSMKLALYAELAARELEAMSSDVTLARRARANSPT